MENKSRIRFNPVTKEVEIEGSEEFVKVYFTKLQEMMSGSAAEGLGREKAGKLGKGRRVAASPVQKKIGKTPERAAGEKRITNVGSVVALIQGSEAGISTTEIKEKTGLTERQIWSIVDRAAKDGKIRKMKRGVYASVPSGQE